MLKKYIKFNNSREQRITPCIKNFRYDKFLTEIPLIKNRAEEWAFIYIRNFIVHPKQIMEHVASLSKEIIEDPRFLLFFHCVGV